MSCTDAIFPAPMHVRVRRGVRSRQPDADIAADPFHERSHLARFRAHLLGADFEFETGSPQLRRLVEWAYGGLPEHRLPSPAPRIHVKLVLGSKPQRGRSARAPRVELLSGRGLLGGATARSDLAIIAPRELSALIVASRDMFEFRYETRYELIEFAVFTLAARALRLVPLHAACVGQGGRGLILIGASGTGKSTASLHCALNGLELVSEDSLFIEPTAMLATGVANFVHVRRSSLRYLPKATAAALGRSPVIRRRSGVEKLEISLRHPSFCVAAAPVKVAGVVFITSRRAATGRLLKELPTGESLRRIHATQPYAASRAGWGQFIRNIAAAPAYELMRGGHPRDSVQVLQGLLTAGAALLEKK